MDGFVQNFLNPAILQQVWPYLLTGLGQTLLLAVLVIPAGAVVGLAIAAAQIATRGPVRVILSIWIDFWRAFPPLVLLIYLFFGLPLLGYDIGMHAAIAITFILNTSSYFAEIFRAGIESVPRGQWEASRATGMSWRQSFLVIVMPQSVRIVMPDLLSNVITVTQLTSLASVVGMNELLHTAQLSQATTYNVTPIIAAALLYLIVLWPLVRLVSFLDGRRHGTALGEAHR